MFLKFKVTFSLLILGLALILPFQALAMPLTLDSQEDKVSGISSSEISEVALNTEEGITYSSDESQQLDSQSRAPAVIVPTPLTNGSWSSSGSISSGGKRYYVLESVPFNSAKYRIRGWEYQPASMNINLYVKFGALPSTSDYDYLSATGSQNEQIDIEIPRDNDYGNMYIMIYCVSGSGYTAAYAHYVSDSNGCWRTADYLSTPRNGDPAIHISGAVDATDANDFYRVFLYSGQEFKIDGEATTGFTLACYFYDENYILINSDTSGIWMDITHKITAFESSYYYVRFKCMGTARNNYISDFTDENPEFGNRYDDALGHLVLNLTDAIAAGGIMDSSDTNDYWYFRADSGQHFQIQITVTGVDSPYYDAFLYSTSPPINDEYVEYDRTGTTLTIDYYCGEYYTSEVHSHGNLVFLRIWNAAAHYGMPDSTGSYSMTITRSYAASNDHMGGAVPYTTYGANDTTPKYGDLNGEADNNDWFKISTKAGYTIKIAVNGSSDVAYPYLDGYLYDSSGTFVDSDYDYNITITYTATYTGDYFFRLYEAAAQYYYGPYTGIAEYDWYIYTTAYDGNDNFTTAEELTPPETVSSSVSSVDLDDYYKFEVPSGYEISVTGTSSPSTELYLYNPAQTEIASDTSSPWSITYQHKGLETETYYARVHNAAAHTAASYTLTITLTKLAADDDMAGATSVPVATGGNETGSDSMDSTDINDYYAFYAVAGDKIIITVDGENGLIARLVMSDGDTEITLAEGTLGRRGLTILEYFPRSFAPGELYYLRVCNPDGALSGSYTWNITLVEFDTTDGYSTYSNELTAGTSVTINDQLSASDTNDWYHFVLRSGERVEITLTSTIPDPHAGLKLWTGWYSKIADQGQTVQLNATNWGSVPVDCWIQVLNENGTSGSYTLGVTFTLLDDDSNGAPDIAETLVLDTNHVDALAPTDINDFYAVEIRSGYNLTVKVNAVGFGLPIYCILVDESGTTITWLFGNGTMTYINTGLDPIIGYIQFWNDCPYSGFNSTLSTGQYFWNATLVNDDPDGDFSRATTITGPTSIVSDTLFADTAAIPANYSDINDFYNITLGQGDVLSLAVTTTGVSDPWFGVYVYDASENLVASETGADTLNLLFNVGADAGLYYIRLYNIALEAGSYTMALAVYTDTDSYFGGATAITAGHQTADSLSNSDVVDFYSIHLDPGWRMKVNVTLTGTAPDVDLLIFDPAYLDIAADFAGTTYLEVEITAESAGTYYIEFYNTGGNAVNYDWWVYVYEDENGIFSTSTGITDGTHTDNVQELDKYDYFSLTGTVGQAFTVTCSLSGLNLELYLYDSSQGLIDSDITGPGLAVTHTPSSGDLFFIMFSNPNGETGSYTFTVTGAGAAPTGTVIPTTTTSTTTGAPGFLLFSLFSGILVISLAAVLKRRKR